MNPPITKIIVTLSAEDHKKLKGIVKKTRRTLGRELAYRAFEAIKEDQTKETEGAAT